MVQKILADKKYIFLISLVAVIIFIYYINGIRQLGYSLVPSTGILDEYSYVWQGMSLRKEGVPVAWSIFYGIEPNKNNIGKVKDFSIELNKEKITASNFERFPKPTVAVKELDYGIGTRQIVFMFPFLDHPPLGGLLMSLGVPNSVNTFSDISLKDTRFASTNIAVIVSILIFILAYLVTFRPFIAALSVVVYSTVPSYLLASRFALLENILVPFVLLQLIFLILVNHFKSKKRISMIFLILSAITAGLMLLIKETGAGFIIGSIVMLIVWHFSFKKISLYFILPILTVIGVYLLWASQFSSTILFQILYLQSTRSFVGSLNFLSTLPSLRFENFPLDGWWVWGFISFGLIGLKEGQKYLSILIPAICNLILVLLLGGPNFPWYYLTLIPFFAIFIALGIFYIYKSPAFSSILSFMLIPLSSSFYWGYSVLHQPLNIWTYRLLFLICIIISSFRILKPLNSKIRIIWLLFCFGLLMLIIRWNIKSLYFIIANFDKLPFPSFPTN